MGGIVQFVFYAANLETSGISSSLHSQHNKGIDLTVIPADWMDTGKKFKHINTVYRYILYVQTVFVGACALSMLPIARPRRSLLSEQYCTVCTSMYCAPFSS